MIRGLCYKLVSGPRILYMYRLVLAARGDGDGGEDMSATLFPVLQRLAKKRVDGEEVKTVVKLLVCEAADGK